MASPEACTVNRPSVRNVAPPASEAGPAIQANPDAERKQNPRWRGVYEQPTPEKVAYGSRLRAAREISGMNLTEAAEALGYSQPVQLSLMETGQRMVTLKVLHACAAMYGTTADYLCGLTPCSDRDPALGAQRLIASQITAELRRMLAGMTALSVDAMRELKPDAGRMIRLAELAIEARASLERMRASSPTFDNELVGGARLVTKLTLAADIASEHLDHVARARRALAASPLDVVSHLVGADGNADPTAWPSLDPTSVVVHDDGGDEPESDDLS